MEIRLVLLLAIIGFSQTVAGQNDTTKIADKPLFKDPVLDGAADPCVIWNSQENKWYMFYTNRRANIDSLDGVSWVHGTQIGIATSQDGGAKWSYKGVCNINFKPTDAYSYWAPDIIKDNNLSYVFNLCSRSI